MCTGASAVRSDYTKGGDPMSMQTGALDALVHPRRSKSPLGKEWVAALLFLTPALIGFFVFFAFPIARGLYISFTDWDLLTEPEWIGLENYRDLVSNKDFRQSLIRTAYYVVLNIPLQTVLALGIALIFDRYVRGSGIRSLLLLPWLIPNVIVALLFLWLLDANLGIVNEVLGFFGIGKIAFFGNPDWAMPTIAGINIWRHMGYTALLILAGMSRIPTDIYEAGALDGATEAQMFRQITLPLLRPVVTFVLVTSVVGSFQIYDTIAVTTEGGPVRATRVVYWFIYEHAFERFNFGFASAAAFILFMILLVVSLIQMRILRANETYLD